MVIAPVFSDIAPLPPRLGTSAVRTLKAPLEDDTPKPETIEIEPPVDCVLCPPLITKRPPACVFPLPIDKLMLPLAPVVCTSVDAVVS